jgi:ABC-type amino acid transport substrate-binding protein
MRKILATAVMALSTLAVAAPLAQAKTLKEIKFGVDATYPPFESLSPSGEFVGFDIDLGKAICADLKVKCTFVAQGFDGIIPALEARKFDAILSKLISRPKCITSRPA